MFGQWVLCKYSAETTQVTTSTASLQIQHVHLGLVSCWDNKCAITRSWSFALREVKNLTGLCRLIGKVGGSTTPVAPADVADDLGILHSFNGAIESLDSPIFEAIGPGKLVELNEINAEGIYFENVFVDCFGNIHCPITARLVVQVIGSLSKHLNACILYFGGLVRSFLKRFGLLHHYRSSSLDFLC